VKRLIASLLLVAVVVGSGLPVMAKARVIAVFALRSTPEDAQAASMMTKAIVAKIGSIDGFDAVVPAVESGSGNGAAAARIGAESYIVGQVTASDIGYNVRLGSYESATDRPVSSIKFATKSAAAMSDVPDLHELIGLAAGSQTSAASASTSATGANAANGTLVPGGTTIHLAVATPLSSSSAKVGDTFAIRVVDELVIDGMVVVEKGASGQGTIAMVEGAGSNGHAGKLGLQYDFVTAADGNKIKLSNTQHTDQGEGQGGKASTATVATYLLLGPLGLFAHNFVRGKDLTIDEKTKLTAFVDSTVHVNATRKSQPGAGYAK